MADNLTVKSPGAGSTSAPGSSSTEKKVDDGRAELEKLRGLAKSRHGKSLDDKTLKAIIQRRKAKIQHQEKIADTKQTYESSSAKEKLTNKAQDAETKTQKATGTQEVRTKEGLTPKDQKKVTSDSKSGPKLPTTDGKATTPQQAKSLVGKMLANVLVDGQPVDVEAYAKTLKEKPATQPKQTAQQGKTGDGKQTARQAPGKPAMGQKSGAQNPSLTSKSGGFQSTNRGAPTSTQNQANQTAGQQGRGNQSTTARQPGGAPQTTPQTTTQAKAGGPGTKTSTNAPPPGPKGGGPGTTGKPGGMGAQTGGAGTTGKPGLGAQTGAPPRMGMESSMPNARGPSLGAGPGANMMANSRLSFRPGQSDTRLSETAVDGDGLFNAGGGLITGSSFDGMSFNWDAFFAQFAIRSQKDMHEWRKAMKELARMESESALQGMKAKLALTKMRQFFGRKKAIDNFKKAVGRSDDAYRAGKAMMITGQKPDAVKTHLERRGEQMSSAVGKDGMSLHDRFGGRDYLTAGEIETLRQEAAEMRSAGRTAEADQLLAVVDGNDEFLANVRRDGGLAAALALRQDALSQRHEYVDGKLRELFPPNGEITQVGVTSLTEEQAAEWERVTNMRDTAPIELHSEINAMRGEYRREVHELLQDPKTAAYLNAQRSQMRGRAGRADEQARELRTSGGDQGEIDRLEWETSSLLRQIWELDVAMAHGETRGSEFEADMQNAVQDFADSHTGARVSHALLQSETQRPEISSETPEQRRAHLQGLWQSNGGPVDLDGFVATTDADERSRMLESVPQVQRSALETIRTEMEKVNEGETGAQRVDRLDESVESERGQTEVAGERARYIEFLVNSDPYVDGEMVGPPGAHTNPGGEYFRNDDAGHRQHLYRAADAGGRLQKVREGYSYDLKTEKIIDRIDGAIDDFGNRMDGSAFTAAVDNAIAGAISTARKHSAEINAEMRQSASRSQGMINQLIQLMGMARSR